MKLQDYIDKWNTQPDEHGDWSELDCDKKLEWVIRCTNENSGTWYCDLDDGYPDCVLDASGTWLPSDCDHVVEHGYKKPTDCPHWRCE